MKRGYMLLSLLGLTVIALSIVQISVSNMLSTEGIELAQIQSQSDSYQKDNAILKEKIYSVASLTHIGQVAQKLGYVEGVNKTTLVIANPQPLAIKP